MAYSPQSVNINMVWFFFNYANDFSSLQAAFAIIQLISLTIKFTASEADNADETGSDWAAVTVGFTDWHYKPASKSQKKYN